MGLLMPFACISYAYAVENRRYHVLKSNIKGKKCLGRSNH